MADDLLTTLGNRLHDGQTRLAYFLMAVNASAVALVLRQMEGATTVSIILLATVASWAIAFCLGVAYLLDKNAALVANIQGAKVGEGSHELVPAGSVLAPEAERRLIAQFKEFNDKARASAQWQLRVLVLGAALYAVWLVTRERPIAW